MIENIILPLLIMIFSFFDFELIKTTLVVVYTTINLFGVIFLEETILFNLKHLSASNEVNEFMKGLLIYDIAFCLVIVIPISFNDPIISLILLITTIIKYKLTHKIFVAYRNYLQ